jgi:hypothetical protein
MLFTNRVLLSFSPNLGGLLTAHATVFPSITLLLISKAHLFAVAASEKSTKEIPLLTPFRSLTILISWIFAEGRSDKIKDFMLSSFDKGDRPLIKTVRLDSLRIFSSVFIETSFSFSLVIFELIFLLPSLIRFSFLTVVVFLSVLFSSVSSLSFNCFFEGLELFLPF